MSGQAIPDALRPLVDLVRAGLVDEVMSRVRAELAAQHAEALPQRVVLSLADAVERYGIGRLELKRLIAGGRLPAFERRARGGRTGTYMHLADCERVLAGRAIAPRATSAKGASHV